MNDTIEETRNDKPQRNFSNWFGIDDEPDPDIAEVIPEEDNPLDDVRTPDELSFLEFLAKMSSERESGRLSENDLDGCESSMDANQYHNKAVDLVKSKNSRGALNICLEGLEKFPHNVDLLADTIKYASNLGEYDIAREHYLILKDSVPFQRWNWRAFTFSFDFLFEEDFEANEQACRDLVVAFKKHLPYVERAFIAESELETALGNSERCMEVLKQATETMPNACQCGLKLADMQLERGLYEDVIVSADYAVAASAEAQPSINMPYLCYIRSLAKDSLLHKREANGEMITKAEIDSIISDYTHLRTDFPELLPYTHTIRTRESMLKLIKTA